MASRGKAGTTRPDDVPDEVWAEAVRRAAVVAPLAREDCLTRVRVRDAARELGLSLPSAYRLIALYRKNSVAASLVPHCPGPTKGARRLPTGMEGIVECALAAIHAQRERPTLARLQRDVKRDCNAARLKPPSRKALAARVSARSLQEMIPAREGPEAACQRFAPVRPGPRPIVPSQLVQADHTWVDLMLVDAATHARLGRTWLTLVLDVCTRCVLRLHVAFAPSSAGVALAMAQAVLVLGQQPVTLPDAAHAAGREVDAAQGEVLGDAHRAVAGLGQGVVEDGLFDLYQATSGTGPSAISVPVWGCRDAFRPLGGSGGGAARTRRGRTWFA